jgi:hypothetical protein
MIFKRGFWFAVAVGATVLNVGAAIYAFVLSEPVHAFLHGAGAFGFALLAVYLRPRSSSALPRVAEADRTQLLEADLSQLERELRETRERLEFTEQLLKNKPPAS